VKNKIIIIEVGSTVTKAFLFENANIKCIIPSDLNLINGVINDIKS